MSLTDRDQDNPSSDRNLRSLKTHSVQKLTDLFHETFFATYHTLLVRGGEEPVYLPADESHCFHRIIFTRDYFSSALHEIAHWCIAGDARRKQIDYGYWYRPDGRDAATQAAFERSEVRPQAIEWAFSIATNHPFHISLDNLNNPHTNESAFTCRVRTQRNRFRREGFPHRAQQFLKALRGS